MLSQPRKTIGYALAIPRDLERTIACNTVYPILYMGYDISFININVLFPGLNP